MSAPSADAPPLDLAVLTAVASLRDADVPNPDILCLLGTGIDVLPSELVEELKSVSLSDIPGVPEMWRGCVLGYGSVLSKDSHRATVWVLEDVGLDTPEAPHASAEPAFATGFPCWMAAFAGATLLIHTSAAGALVGANIQAGQLAVIRDHINLSGASPLHALGESKLGPLFPDVSQLHSPCLRREALDFALGEGLELMEVVVACAAPVSLATPAERDWFRTAGADIWIQGIANPLLAAAHAGLKVLALTAVTADSGHTTDIPAMLAASSDAAPRMSALIAGVFPAAVSFASRTGPTKGNA